MSPTRVETVRSTLIPSRQPAPVNPALIKHEQARRPRRAKSDSRHDYALRRLYDVRLRAHNLVRGVDRLARRALPVRAVDDDRVPGGNLLVDVRLDQPEPRRRQAASRRRSAMADSAGGGSAEPGTARSLEPDPRSDEGRSRVCTRGRRAQAGRRRAPGCNRPAVLTSLPQRIQEGRNARERRCCRRDCPAITAEAGFTISDQVSTVAAFMRCSTNYHNVLGQQAPVNFLHHTSWQVDDVDDFGRGATAMLE